jgi:ADP-heptose:LPS heptosyltransferase
MSQSGEVAFGNVRSILISVSGGYADCVRAVPYLRATRLRFPDALIAVLTPAWGTEVLAHCPYLDRIIPLHRTNSRSRWHRVRTMWSVLREVRGGYDLFISSPYHLRFNAAFAHLMGVRQRVGFSVRGMPAPWTVNVGPVDYRRGLEWNRDQLWRALGVEHVDPQMEIWPSPDDEHYVDRLLEGWEVGTDDVLVALHPGSDWGCQQWMPGHWAALGQELQRRYNARLVVTGTASEAEEYRAIALRMQSAPIDATGKTSLGQLGALLRRTRALVSVDSVAVALGLAAQVPVVSLEFRNPSAWSHSRWPNLTSLQPPPSLSGMTANQSCRIRKQRQGVHWCKPPVCIGTEAATAMANLISVPDVLDSLGKAMPSSADDMCRHFRPGSSPVA